MYIFFKFYLIPLAGGNRFATLLLYINDVIEGGETLFPYVNPRGDPVNREKVGDLDRWERMTNIFHHHIIILSSSSSSSFSFSFSSVSCK
jgi:hypothetical protein